jgi:hypothetical protein
MMPVDNDCVQPEGRLFHGPTDGSFHLLALTLLIFTYPLFNLVTQRQFASLDYLATPVLGPLSACNIAQLLWVAVVGCHLIFRSPYTIFRDGYVIFTLLYVSYNLLNDFRLGIFVFAEYLPLAMMNISIYLAAVQVPSERWHSMRAGVMFALGIYAAFAILQVFTGRYPYEGRLSSCFANPNFLAMNLFHLLVLAMLVASGKLRLAMVCAAICGMVASKTRTMLIVLPLALSALAKRFWLACLVAGLLYGIAAVTVSFAPSWFRFNDKYELQGLNGRMGMWNNIVDRGELDIIFGSGSDSVRRQKLHPMYRAGKIEGYYLPQNHYILIASETGIVGLALWIGGILAYMLYIRRTDSSANIRIPSTFVLTLLAGQMTENYLFAPLMVHLIMGMGRRLAWEQQSIRTFDAVTAMPLAQ